MGELIPNAPKIDRYRKIFELLVALSKESIELPPMFNAIYKEEFFNLKTEMVLYCSLETEDKRIQFNVSSITHDNFILKGLIIEITVIDKKEWDHQYLESRSIPGYNPDYDSAKLKYAKAKIDLTRNTPRIELPHNGYYEDITELGVCFDGDRLQKDVAAMDAYFHGEQDDPYLDELQEKIVLVEYVINTVPKLIEEGEYAEKYRNNIFGLGRYVFDNFDYIYSSAKTTIGGSIKVTGYTNGEKYLADILKTYDGISLTITWPNLIGGAEYAPIGIAFGYDNATITPGNNIRLLATADSILRNLSSTLL